MVMVTVLMGIAFTMMHRVMVGQIELWQEIQYRQEDRKVMTKQKLIFLDIDGTLTEAGSNIPPDSALTAIRQAQRNGHKIALCSGRNYGMLSPLLHYGFDAIIGSAGGYIQCGEEIVYDCPMTSEQQSRVMDIFAKNGVYRTIEGKYGSYTDEGFKQFLAESAGGNSEQLRWRRQLESNLGIRPMSEYNGEAIYKLIFMTQDAERLNEPRRLLENGFLFCVQDVDENGIINGELINLQFNKGLAVKRLCEFLKIPLADTIAFGDSMNDREMMETAALSICMGNGSETLKALSDEVCPPVWEDGLYKAFAQHGLI